MACKFQKPRVEDHASLFSEQFHKRILVKGESEEFCELLMHAKSISLKHGSAELDSVPVG